MTKTVHDFGLANARGEICGLEKNILRIFEFRIWNESCALRVETLKCFVESAIVIPTRPNISILINPTVFFRGYE